MFSIITIASSTTKPDAIVSAISDRLSRLKPQGRHSAKGRDQRHGKRDARDHRRPKPPQEHTKITSTTRDDGQHQREFCTSLIAARMVTVRSVTTEIFSPGGNAARNFEQLFAALGPRRRPRSCWRRAGAARRGSPPVCRRTRRRARRFRWRQRRWADITQQHRGACCEKADNSGLGIGHVPALSTMLIVCAQLKGLMLRPSSLPLFRQVRLSYVAVHGAGRTSSSDRPSPGGPRCIDPQSDRARLGRPPTVTAPTPSKPATSFCPTIVVAAILVDLVQRHRVRGQRQDQHRHVGGIDPLDRSAAPAATRPTIEPEAALIADWTFRAAASMLRAKSRYRTAA